MEQKVLRAVMVCLLLMSMAILGRETATYVETVNVVNALQGNNADTDVIPTVVIMPAMAGMTRGRLVSTEHRRRISISGSQRN